MALINADELMKWCNNHYDFEVYTVGYISNLIKDIPTVEAEPIAETTLTIREMGSIEECRCSKCRMVWLWNGDLFIFNYCPNCGARVVGKRYKKERKDDETD